MRHALITGILLLGLLAASCGGGTSAGLEDTQPVAELVAKGPDAGHSSSVGLPAFTDPTPEDKQTLDLIAGQHYNAGYVEYSNDGDYLYVDYYTTDGWLMSEAHVYVGATPPDGKGNPGRFGNTQSFDPSVDHCSFMIPLDDAWAPKSTMYIALHASASNGDQTETLWGGDWNSGSPSYGYSWNKKWGGYADFCLAPFPELPADPVSVKGFHWGSFSFWDVVFANQSLALPVGDFATSRGVTYAGWCIDLLHSMYSDRTYNVTLYSSYDSAIPSGFGMPITSNGNFDFVNYMVNQRHNPTAGGPFDGVAWNTNANKQQFQNAVWYFTNNEAVGAGSLAESFIEDAIANGDNFIPCEGEYYGIVLFPDVSTNDNRVRAQFNLIEVDP